MDGFYNDFSSWIRKKFPFRVQKISIDAGFSCPNRDGNVGIGGCTYCNNQTFNPNYCDRHKSVTEQLEVGKSFFSHKYPDMKYLAYFQAYSNTYASLQQLKALYEEALLVEDVVGLVIGTRPDCVNDELLDYLVELQKHTFVLVEYGIESVNDDTLKRINRGHDFACCQQAIMKTHACGLLCGGHIILGLPGEDALRPTLVLERFVSQSPANLLIAPKWGLKNYEFTNLLCRYMQAHGIRQGAHFMDD